MIKKVLLLCLLLIHLYAETFSDKGFALSGDIKYNNLRHFDYVNPNAPKAGYITLYAIGHYNTLNPLNAQKIPAAGLELLYDTLSVRSEDEPYSEYGLIAERIQRDSDNNFVIFHLNQEARFHDGSEVSAFDVEFSFHMIKEYQHPFLKTYYEDVDNVVVVDKWTVRFNFKNNKNKELPFILGQMQIFPKKFFQNDITNSQSLKIPLGGGPYQIDEIDESGTKITYRLAENYWAKNHPTRIGQYNFKKVTYQYFKDDAAALKAFNTGLYDYREEYNARNWIKGYNSRLLKSKMIHKIEVRHSLPSGMQGFFMNTRQEIFQDIAVREALTQAFDFEWANKNLFFSQYTRTKSYFDNSPLASFGTPLEQEKNILNPFKDQLPTDLFTQSFELPNHTHKNNATAHLKKAASLLKKAGWKKIKGKLYKNGKPFTFTLLVDSVDKKRLGMHFQKNLSTLGIEMKIRSVNTEQYFDSLKKFDYDMIIAKLSQSLAPRSEQRFFFSSQSMNEEGSLNYSGIHNAIVDQMIEKIINAESHEELVDYVRVLDRVLLWQYYVIPHFYSRSFKIAYWDRFSRPDITPLYGTGFWSWWVDEAKEQKLVKKNKKLERE